jgi:hypothetical protein
MSDLYVNFLPNPTPNECRILEQRRVGKKLLNEECHVFNHQYECAEIIAEKVLQCIFEKKESLVVDYDCISFQKIYVSIKLIINKEDSTLCWGAFYSLNKEEESIKLLLTINLSELKRLGHNKAKNKIAATIIHEIMHGHISMNRHKKSENVFDAPDYYDKIQNVTRNAQAESLLYGIARGLYLTYYQEAQAITSQAWKETLNNFQQWNYPPTRDGFIKAFFGTDSYEDYSSALYWYNFLLERKDLIPDLIQKLGKYGINLPKNKIKLFSVTQKKLEKTLRLIMKSCWYYFNKMQNSKSSD